MSLNMPNVIKAVFLDLDGTLLNPNHELMESTIHLIKRLVTVAEIPVFLISARPPAGIKPHYDTLSINTPFIAYNGAIIGPYLGNDASYQDERNLTIPLKFVSPIVEESLNHDFTICIYKGNSIFIDDVNNPYALREHHINRCELIRYNGDLTLQDWEKKGIGPHKIQCIGEEDKISQFIHLIREKYTSEELHISKSGSRSYEITNPIASKGQSIEYLMNRSSINLENVMAMGDNYNDLEGLKIVGYGIAMGNAVESIKSQVKYSTGTNSEDGVGQALKRFFPFLEE